MDIHFQTVIKALYYLKVKKREKKLVSMRFANTQALAGVVARWTVIGSQFNHWYCTLLLLSGVSKSSRPFSSILFPYHLHLFHYLHLNFNKRGGGHYFLGLLLYRPGIHLIRHMFCNSGTQGISTIVRKYHQRTRNRRREKKRKSGTKEDEKREQVDNEI